jgi:D-alanine-D-alanine ligase-like ATP-grasp enzyme
MAYLDLLNLPYSFSQHATHALCLDKEKTNVLVYQLGTQVPFQYIAETSESFPETYPVIMKPNH